MRTNLTTLLPKTETPDFFSHMVHDLGSSVFVVHSSARILGESLQRDRALAQERDEVAIRLLLREAERLTLVLETLSWRYREVDWPNKPTIRPITVGAVLTALSELPDTRDSRIRIQSEAMDCSAVLMTNLSDLANIVRTITFCFLPQSRVNLHVSATGLLITSPNAYGISDPPTLLFRICNPFKLALLAGASNLAAAISISIDFVATEEECGFRLNVPIEEEHAGT